MGTAISSQRRSRPVAIWLLVGVVMIIIQVLLGGITRLTGSGLSITEWQPIMGALPPMDEQGWQLAFDKYKQIAQYKYLNQHFDLSDFKIIFFWEWFHRLWARLIGVVFIIPFLIFLKQGRIRKDMIRPLIILFVLGLLQALVGWIMVASGLNDSELVYVSHYKLAIHFILALGLLVYTLWFAMELIIKKDQLLYRPRLNRFTIIVTGVLVLQLIYGAFMAGLKAATAAPTWPTINGVWIPENIYSFGSRTFSGLSFLFDHPLVIHFIHRNLAYLLVVLLVAWAIKAYKKSEPTTALFRQLRIWPIILTVIQVILGIFTALYSPRPDSFLWLAVAHQFVAMLLLLSLFSVMYVFRRRG